MNLTEYLQKRGSRQAFAEKLGVPAPLISQWANGDREVPVERCAAIELATEGHVTVDELCPASPWVRVEDKDWPHPDGRPLLDIARAPTGHEPTEAKVA